MSFRPTALLIPATFALVFLGCQPQIGDDCIQDLDCSQLGDRICDTTQPGGYCTQFNCSPNSCPEGEAICVAFSNTPSTAIGCSNRGRTSPYVRNFCMKNCSKDSDCREGYICLDVAEDNPWGADIIEETTDGTSVCVLPTSAEAVPLDRILDEEENVCLGASDFAGVGEGGAGGAGGAPN